MEGKSFDCGFITKFPEVGSIIEGIEKQRPPDSRTPFRTFVKQVSMGSGPILKVILQFSGSRSILPAN